MNDWVKGSHSHIHVHANISISVYIFFYIFICKGFFKFLSRLGTLKVPPQ